MADCKNIVHPFQHDPGTSQGQRARQELEKTAPAIDGRTFADLLENFTRLSRHINFYDDQLAISDWQPFFTKSVPFTLASISKYDVQASIDKFDLYKLLYQRRPGKAGLQLIVYYFYYNTIYRINNWHLSVKGTGLPFEAVLQSIIQDRLREPVINFILLAKTAAHEHCMQSIDFTALLNNDVWDIDAADLNYCDWQAATKRPRFGHHNRLIGLLDALTALWPALAEAIRLLASVAGDSIEDSLTPLKEELKQQHTPHLALLFAFLKLFRYLQEDLNTYSRKHLDFFFKDVLRIEPRPATSDKAHIVFEIQKQLNSYLLKKGLVLKDGKDGKGAEILFDTDDDIVVNKAQAIDLRTLYLDTAPVRYNNKDRRLIKGVYMAPKARLADGKEQAFPEPEKSSWPTLGNRYGKFIETGDTTPSPYPHARIGFILATPVLQMAEGKRTVSISLVCQLNRGCMQPEEEVIIKEPLLFNALKNFVKNIFVVVTKAGILKAQAKGISNSTLEKLAKLLPAIEKQDCCPKKLPTPGAPVDIEKMLSERETSIQLTKKQWVSFLKNATPLDFTDDIPANEQLILKELFKEQRPFQLQFSGKDAWIEPSMIVNMRISHFAATDFYKLNFKVRLKADKPAVTFYDRNKLGEDFNTTEPVVKITLNPAIDIGFKPEEIPETDHCCFKACEKQDDIRVSAYSFLRNLTVVDFLPTVPPAPVVHRTIVHIKVCGLKNFVVQNDENVGDVNSIIFPFGSRPKKDANFYIGSKEVLCKNWVKMALRFYWKDLPDPLEDYYHGYEDIFEGIVKDDFKKDKFLYSSELLDEGSWFQHTPFKKKLFESDPQQICGSLLTGEYKFFFQRSEFLSTPYVQKPLSSFDKEVFTNSSRNGFLKITLRDKDFQHSRYSFVLARQMMALGKFPKEIYIGPVYDGFPPPPAPLPGSIQTLSIDELFSAIESSYNVTDNLDERLQDVITKIRNGWGNFPHPPLPFNLPVDNNMVLNALGNPAPAFGPGPLPGAPPYNPPLAQFRADFLTTALFNNVLKPTFDKIKDLTNKRVVIPNEPYTPQIKGISMDYTAIAKFEDITLIHLYPYEHTYKEVAIEGMPPLFPTFCDQGTLFIGLEGLVPDTNVNILFQLAEATANSEAGLAPIEWHYLVDNEWKLLRNGFEVLEDATNGLTTSGIVKLAIPGNISTFNTVMPKGLHWIKVAAPRNVDAVSETIGIHTQAICATFVQNTGNDLLRLSAPLDASKLSKLQEADASVKKVAQPYESFGGREPEASGYYYTRVSEWLRHKGRGIQKFDYERLVLDAFPQLFKVKCINHDFALDARNYRYDVNAAPGYVVVAVIPDLNQMKAGQTIEPKAPVSLLEKITQFLRKCTTPFARIHVVNPRYERIDICLEVQLLKGKDKVYFKHKLEEDLRLFLAPWAIGELEKLRFGQCVNRSDLVRFIEALDYVDYIICLKMKLDDNCVPDGLLQIEDQICPLTPRSILIGGKIDVCIPEMDCERWENEQSTCTNQFEVSPVTCKQIDPIP